MRMWMLPPIGMCRKHLLGEHVELHMLLGSMRRSKSIEGFLSGGLVDPQLVFARHEELVAEMARRGFRHSSPIEASECTSLAARYPGSTFINIAANAAELQRRCPDCAHLMQAKSATAQSTSTNAN